MLSRDAIQSVVECDTSKIAKIPNDNKLDQQVDIGKVLLE